MERRAKIVATIGPASQDEQVLKNLMHAGMNVARLNFSHGLHEEHAERIACLRKLSEQLGLPVGILQQVAQRSVKHSRRPLRQ